MASTKKIAALVAVSWMITGCSGMVKEPAIHPAYLVAPSAVCLSELHQKLEALTGLSGIEDLSSTPFENSDTLLLTNHPRKPFPADNPMVGVVGSQIILKLYRKGARCMVRCFDERGRAGASATLERCRCEKVAAE